MPKPRAVVYAGRSHGVFHCVSRVVDRRFVFDPAERERFGRLLRAVEAFSGVQVLTWTILSNHFHVVVAVPEREDGRMPDEVLWRRMAALYSPAELQAWRERFDRHADPERLRRQITDRMEHLGEFMKTLKLRFSKGFNRRHGRTGTLWEERFRSIRVEDSPEALAAVCAYVDLNSVRAGIVDDPSGYRWCGYAEATSGSSRAREGLGRIWRQGTFRTTLPSWRGCHALYRSLLEPNASVPSSVPKTRTRRGRAAPPMPDLLRHRLRFVSDGLAIGRRAFLEDFLHHYRQTPGGEARKRAGRRPGRGAWGELLTFRKPQRRAITRPSPPPGEAPAPG